MTGRWHQRQFIKDHSDIQVVAVHIVGLDNVSHAFSQYRFPEDYPKAPPAVGDVQRFGKVVDRYREFLDVRIGKLVAAFPEPPNVIVISDHGHGPSEIATFWRDFHTSPGLFIAAGPDIPASERPIQVSYYDLVPTILDLKGFVKPISLRGSSVVGRFRDPE